MKTLHGKRIADNTMPENKGEYSKFLDTKPYGKPYWMLLLPNGLLGSIVTHTIVEHEDNTITVSPSILTKDHKESWHGYLEKGVWREC